LEALMSWLMDIVRTMVMGVVLGVVLAYINLYIMKREAKKVMKPVLKELNKHLQSDGELKARVEEYARIAGNAFVKEVITSVMTELRKSPLTAGNGEVEDLVEEIRKKLSL